MQMARSSVPKAISDLETDLGVRLLRRSTRTMTLTASGEAFLARAHAVLRDVDGLSTMFDAPRAAPRGKPRVKVPTRIGRLLITPRLPGFFARYPAIELDLSATDRAVDILGEGFDCALRVGEQTVSGLRSRKLGALRMVNCAAPAYLARHGTPASLDDLSLHRAVGYVSARRRRDAGWHYQEHGRPRAMRLPVSVRVNSAEIYIACARAGLGLIQVPAYDVADLIASQELIEVLPDHPCAPMPVAVVAPDRPSRVPTVAAFGDWIAEVCAPAFHEGAPAGPRPPSGAGS